MKKKTKTDPAHDRARRAGTTRHSVIPAQAGIGFLTTALIALLAACSSTEPPPPKAAKVSQRDWVSHVRAEAAQIASSVEVVPLVDPELDDLRAAARTQESSGDVESATKTIEQALALHPQDPALLQWRAELALAVTAWKDAERIAQRSYDLGPRLGEICVRNWLTIEAARTERGDKPGAASAAAQVANCQVKPVLRM
jgi:Flp pilus assembly protein TadD